MKAVSPGSTSRPAFALTFPGARTRKTFRVPVGRHFVAVDVHGETGPLVVLLHGIPGWRGMWSSTASLLDGCRVVAPDLLGFGESSPPSGDFHAEGQSEMVVTLIRKISCEPVHLVGFDFGGPIAVLAYRKAPELVATLALAATNVLAETPIPPPLQLLRAPIVGQLAAHALFGRLGLSIMWKQAVSRKDEFPFSRYGEMLRFPNGITWTRRLFSSSLRNLQQLYAPVEAALAGIRAPCSVLWGDRDPFFSLEAGKRTAARIPGAKFVCLRGCGHFLPEEDARGFATAVRDLVLAEKQ